MTRAEAMAVVVNVARTVAAIGGDRELRRAIAAFDATTEPAPVRVTKCEDCPCWEGEDCAFALRPATHDGPPPSWCPIRLAGGRVVVEVAA